MTTYCSWLMGIHQPWFGWHRRLRFALRGSFSWTGLHWIATRSIHLAVSQQWVFESWAVSVKRYYSLQYAIACSSLHRIFRTFYKHIEKRKLWARLLGRWNSTLKTAWHVRHAHWARLWYVPFVIWWLWITSTIWLLILSCTGFMVGRSRVFYIYSSWKI